MARYAACVNHDERDENTCRENLSPTEMVELGRQIEAIEKPEAEQRGLANLKIGNNFPKGQIAPSGNEGKSRDKVASALGVSGKTYEKAKQVVEAAKSEPELYGDLPEMMDVESVHAAFEEMNSRSDEPDRGDAGEPEDDTLKQFTDAPAGASVSQSEA